MTVIPPHPPTRTHTHSFDQPISWSSLAALLLAGGGVVWYVRKVKAEKEEGDAPFGAITQHTSYNDSVQYLSLVHAV